MTRKRFFDKFRKWLTFEQAKHRLGDSLSSFVLFRCKRHMVLPPKFLGNVHQGIRETLNSELRMFCNELSGVVIAYNNISVVQKAGNLHDDAPYLHFDIEADFVVFRPTIGCSLRGKINKIGDDHIGCLVHGCVNVSIPLPGHLVESGQLSGSDSSVVTADVDLEFEVTTMVTHNRILTLAGKLKPNSLQNIDLAELQTKQSPAEGLNNGRFMVGNSGTLRDASQSTDGGGSGCEDNADAGSCQDNIKTERKTDSDSVLLSDSSTGKKIKKRKKGIKEEITDSDSVLLSDSNTEKKKKRKDMKEEITDCVTEMGSSSLRDSGIDLSFLPSQTQEDGTKNKKLKTTESYVTSSTASPQKKHKHKRKSRIKQEPA